MKKRIFRNPSLYKLIVLFVLDGLLFGLTNPNKVNSLVLILGFLLLALTLYYLLLLLFGFMIRLGFKIKNRRKLALFTVVVFWILMALQSIGQLSTRDVLVIIPLAILLYVYIAYIRPRTT